MPLSQEDTIRILIENIKSYLEPRTVTSQVRVKDDNGQYKKNDKGEYIREEKTEQKSVEDLINQAVVDRNIVILKDVLGNKGSLKDIDDQFDENGKRLADATFTYSEFDNDYFTNPNKHYPATPRTVTDFRQISGENWSDRDKLVMLSILFGAGTDLSLKYASDANENMIVNARQIVANHLQPLDGVLKSGKSYEPNPELIEKLDQLHKQTKALASEIFRIKEVETGKMFLDKIKDSTLLQANKLVEKFAKKAKPKPTHRSKKALMENVVDALNTFIEKNDIQALQAALATEKKVLDTVDAGLRDGKGETRIFLENLVTEVDNRIKVIQKGTFSPRSSLVTGLQSLGIYSGSNATSPRSPNPKSPTQSQPTSPRPGGGRDDK